ncbi:MAG: peptidase domain-containing ABC transporter [Solirubrobacteraceae bacterium]
MRRRNRVPVMLQQSPNECGAACLAMILNGLGRATSTEECRRRVGGGRDGASARALVDAARSLGAVPTAYALRTADLSGLTLPAIVHWEFDHFLVVERATARWVDVVDPAGGRRRIAAEEFSRGFTGVVVVVLAGPSLDVDRSAASDSRWVFLRLAWRAPVARRLFIQLAVASLVLQLVALAPPFAILLVLDTVVPLSLDSVFTLGAVAIGALFLGQLAASLLRAGILLALDAHVDTPMSLSGFDHLLALPYEFFERRSSGDTVMRLMSTTTIRQVLGTQALGAILDGFVAIGYTVVLLIIDLRVGIVALVLALLQAAITGGSGRLLSVRVDRKLADQGRAQSFLVEAVNGMGTIKATGSESRALERFSGLFACQLRSSMRRAQAGAISDSVNSGLRLITPLVIILIAAQEVLDGRLSPGTMVALAIIGGLLVNGASSAAAAIAQLHLGRGMADRLIDLLRQEPEQERGTLGPAPSLRGEIELRDVTVRYSPSAPPALSDINVRFAPGGKVAIVGPSGSGKSTLAKVVLGLLEPQDGEVLLDGADIENYELSSVRRQFGVVLQDSALFDASIHDNIALHVPDASRERVAEAAAKAHILEEIGALPMGFDTKISEGGRSLSGGQRQRLALARALMRDPRVLILDEATSHLDAVTEAAVDDVLSGLACTRIVIAHRLSTVRNADHIVVLERGQIVEQGRHEHLLAAGGVYAQLLGVQVDRRPGPCNGAATTGRADREPHTTGRDQSLAGAAKFSPQPDVRELPNA